MFGSSWKKRSAGIGIAGLVVTGALGGLGVAGALPGPVQSSMATIAHGMGLDLITSNRSGRADRGAGSNSTSAPRAGLDDTAAVAAT